MFPWIHPFGRDAPSSLGRVYSRQATAWNCENSAVSFVIKWCPISTTFRNPASIQNLFNLYCCDSFSIRSQFYCNRRSLLAGSSQSKDAFVLITLSTSEELDCSITTGLPVLSWSCFILFTYLSNCSVKTELVCRDNYAKNSFNRFQIGCIVYRQFSMSFAYESTSGQCARSAEDWTTTFCEFQQHPFSLLPVSTCGLFSLIQYHFSEPGPMNDHFPACSKSFRKKRNESNTWFAFFIIVFCSPWDVVEHRHEDNSSCEIL